MFNPFKKKAKNIEDVIPQRQKTEHKSYFSDQPIKSKSEDRFQRTPFANQVAQTLTINTDPNSVVIGIYGPWGDGKSSVLELLNNSLKEHKLITPVFFNPWYFESEERLIRSFFETLAQAIGKSLPTKQEEIGKLLEKYGALLSLASVSIGGVISMNPGDAATGLGSSLSINDLRELKARLEKLLQDSGLRVVVMIDDVDRLDKDEIQSIFKLVKLSGGLKNVDYVLAFDEEMVASAIGEKYGNGDIKAGKGFLEKIVQVPLHLPAADSFELRKFTFEGVDAALKQSGIELNEDDSHAYARNFADGIELRLRTPRQAKVYVNALRFSLPLLKDEVNTVDQMLLEGIRIFYPKLYKIIRNHPEFFLKEDPVTSRNDKEIKRINDQIDFALHEEGIEEVNLFKNGILKYLFPRIENVSYGNDWEKTWAKEQRVCSADYFDRYFRYAVPESDIPDTATKAFIDKLPSLSGEDVKSELEHFSKIGSFAKLIKKLRTLESTFDENLSRKLSLALAQGGDLLPREKTAFISDWDFMQGAILISQLLRNIKDPIQRRNLSYELIDKAQPIRFAFECFRWIRKGDKESDKEAILTQEEETEAGKILAKRIQQESIGEAIYKQHKSDTPALLWAWHKYGDSEELSTYMKSLLGKNPNEITDFLDCFVGTAWTIESGLPSRSDFERDNYDSVKKYIDPNFLEQGLLKIYGEELKNPVFHHNNDFPLDKKFAHQFMFVHDLAKAEEQKTAE